MRKFYLYVLLLLLGSPTFTLAALTAEQILMRADAIRTPQQDASFAATVTSVKANGKVDKARYEVLLKGKNKTLIKTLSPAMDRGTSILMLGHDLWVFLPSVEKPIRIALQQRLLGQVANGDLARANFVGDYTPSLIPTKLPVFELYLRAKSDDVTYGSVRLWIDRKTFRPLRADFYAASGRLLKVGSYEGYKVIGGAVRPSRLVFTDAVIKGQVSTIQYEAISLRNDLADKYFTKDYLKKLKY